jgi:hypothetical protein
MAFGMIAASRHCADVSSRTYGPRQGLGPGGLNPRAMFRSAALFALCFFVVGMTGARAASLQCAKVDPSSAMVAKQFGDVYNQVASDGDEAFPSYFAKAAYGTGDYAITWQRHYSKYQTQHAGAQVDTIVHAIDGDTYAIPWFDAVEQTDEYRVERCLGWLRLYAGVGYVQTRENISYPIGYSGLRGAGFGLERYADEKSRWDFFGALYGYPAAGATYGARKLSLWVVTFDGGVRWKVAKDTGTVFGLYQELRELHPGGTRVEQTVRVAPYVGIQQRI